LSGIFDNFSSKFLFKSVGGDFRHNFSHQIFFPLAMATKMVAAWSADLKA